LKPRNTAWRKPAIFPVCLYLAGTALATAGPAMAKCEPTPVDLEVEGQLMTRNEAIELMDDRFYESLARVAECLSDPVSKSQSSAGEPPAMDSAPSPGVQGTESAALASPATHAGDEEADFAAGEMKGMDSPVQKEDGNLGLQGKIPEDIPSPDNDTVLQKQLRRAAMQEPDPVMKQKLWNEYRRYAGLPLQEISDNHTVQTETESENEENH